jgi:predicted O-methyltransferase YrrM
LEDQRLIHHVEEKIKRGPDRHISDRRCSFGRRLGWYALVRAHKPKVVVETGVDKGLGAVLLCAALEKNALDGYPGRYQGTDINPAAGFLLSPPYNAFGEILYGDSIESLRRIPSIDLFINDSDHSSEYERREYEVIQPKLTERAIILGDNSHCTNELAEFSRNHKRVFLFFREEPADHWYPGAGIGITFIRDECP